MGLLYKNDAAENPGDFTDITIAALPSSEPISAYEHKQSYFTEFAKVVYRRLRVYRGIYIFYSIVTFMLGLPVMVTGFKKQFYSEENYDMLYCPHYLGIISLLSCFISLWTAFKNQILICVLTLVTGIVTVISAMIVLVTSALSLSETSANQIADQSKKHLNQADHVVFIFSIGLLIAALAIVITTLSHLSAKRVKDTTSTNNASIKNIPHTVEENTDDFQKIERLQPGSHRYSFASTISSLIKQELKDNKSVSLDTKGKLKKTLSCPNERQQCKKNNDLLGIILPESRRKSTHSLPANESDFHYSVLDRWKRASFLTQHHAQELANGERGEGKNTDQSASKTAQESSV